MADPRPLPGRGATNQDSADNHDDLDGVDLIQQAFLDSLPEQRRGQGFGLAITGTMGGQGLTPALAGALAGTLGAAAAMAVAGAATAAVALALRGSLAGRVRPLPAEVRAAVDVQDLAGNVPGGR